MRSEEQRSWAGTAALWVLLLPIVYALSVGPAFAIALRLQLREEPLVLAYAPVIWLHRNTPLKKPIEMYVEWWISPYATGCRS